jgi:hypothetical protein
MPHHVMSGPPGEYFEVDFGMRICRNDMNQATDFHVFHGLPAANQGLGTEQTPGVDLTVRCRETLAFA